MRELVSKDGLPSLEECVGERTTLEAEALGLQHSPVWVPRVHHCQTAILYSSCPCTPKQDSWVPRRLQIQQAARGSPGAIYNLFCKNQTNAVTQARIQSKLCLKVASSSQESEHSWEGEGIEAVRRYTSLQVFLIFQPASIRSSQIISRES